MDCILYILKNRAAALPGGHPAEQCKDEAPRGWQIRPAVCDTNPIMATVKEVNIQVSMQLDERIRLGTMDYIGINGN